MTALEDMWDTYRDLMRSEDVSAQLKEECDALAIADRYIAKAVTLTYRQLHIPFTI